MAYEKSLEGAWAEIISLSAETIAMSAVLGHVLHEVSLVDPDLDLAIRKGFDDAASFIEQAAIIAGSEAAPTHLVKALEIVENIRSASLSGGDEPKHGV